MKKFALIAAVLALVLLAACAGAEVISVDVDEINKDATAADIVVPFYLPQRLTDGTEVLCALHKKSGNATISSGDKTLVTIDYYDKGADELKAAPALGKASITADGDSYTLVMMLNENIGVVMRSTDITKEELIKTANSFYVEEGPAAG